MYLDVSIAACNISCIIYIVCARVYRFAVCVCIDRGAWKKKKTCKEWEKKTKRDSERKKLRRVFLFSWITPVWFIYLQALCYPAAVHCSLYECVYIYINVCERYCTLRRRLPSFTTETFSSVAIYYYFFLHRTRVESRKPPH